MKSQNGIQKWMIMMKNLKSTIKSIEQIIGTHKWSKGLEGSSDGENIEQNALTEEWKLKIQYHDTSLKSQQKICEILEGFLILNPNVIARLE